MIQNHGVGYEAKSGTFITPWCGLNMPRTLSSASSVAMPSLHLDIPSIDWIARPARGEKPGGGKDRPAESDRMPARPAEPRDRSGRDARQPILPPGRPAGAMA
ncbi:hypothetical protein ACFWZ4_16130 [Frateuria sp. GZRe12]